MAAQIGALIARFPPENLPSIRECYASNPWRGGDPGVWCHTIPSHPVWNDVMRDDLVWCHTGWYGTTPIHTASHRPVWHHITPHRMQTKKGPGFKAWPFFITSLGQPVQQSRYHGQYVRDKTQHFLQRKHAYRPDRHQTSLISSSCSARTVRKQALHPWLGVLG